MDLFDVAGVTAPRRPKVREANPYRDASFSDEELAEFETCPVGQLAAWQEDTREADDQMGCTSKRSRQIAAIIKRRGLTVEQLAEAHRIFTISGGRC